MKETLSFIKGVTLVVLLAVVMVLGARTVWDANKLDAKAGYIVIDKKLYVLTPAEAKVVEPPKPCGQTCNVE